MSLQAALRPFCRSARYLGIACASLLPAHLVMAQGQAAALTQIPAIEEGTPTVVSRLVGSQLELRDAATNEVILALANIPVANSFPAGVNVNVRMQQQPTGADIIVTVKNVTGSPKAMGRMGFGVLNMGENIEYSWTRMNAEMRPANTQTHIGQAWLYPLDLYSPVMVLRNQERTVGISINYPVLEYKHDVRLHINSPTGSLAQSEAGRGWLVYYSFNNEGNETDYTRLQHQAMLPPGEERVYVMSIRTNADTQNWVRTLLPYRDFFRATYGGVQYQRDDTLVAGYNMADAGYQSSANPYGFPHHLRPDQRGYGPTVRSIDNAGWDSTMVWSPSGIYRNNPQLNWPFQMASQLNATQQLATAFSVTEGFPWLVSRGKRVGFWWGRSLEVSTQWDGPESEHFDPANSLHVAAANRELDDAVRAGATLIGLDTFTPYHIPLWDLVTWLDAMKARHPGVEFITEPSQCDILHVHAPTWYDGWLDIEGTTTVRSDLFNIKGPNVLSDFLNPGHESWVGLGYRPPYQRSFGRPTDAQVDADIRQLASWGYRPTVFWTLDQPQNVQFARSWEYTLPQDIRDNDPFIQNIRAGRLPGQNATQPPAQQNQSGGETPPSSGGGDTPPTTPPVDPPPGTTPPVDPPPSNTLPPTTPPVTPPANNTPPSVPPTTPPPNINVPDPWAPIAGGSAPNTPNTSNTPDPTPPTPPVAPIVSNPTPTPAPAANASRPNSIAAQRGIRVSRSSAVSRLNAPVRSNNNSNSNNNNSANNNSNSNNNASPQGPRRTVQRPQQNATSVRTTTVRRPGFMTVVQNQLNQQQQTNADSTNP